MEFRTQIKFEKYNEKIDFSHKILFLGSCFTENIGKKFESNFFQTKINPFGVLYNPISISESLKILLEKRLFEQKDLFIHNNLWHSFFHHSSFSDNNINVCLDKINNNIVETSDFLNNSDFIFITFGTSWVYELSNSKQIVSNCHKLPDSHFNRKLLEVDEIVDKYKELILYLKSQNSKLKFYFTVSPIRHLKDGANGNQISKSILFLSINKLCNIFDFCFYFPSYEIVIDELRDYRFYTSDMVHISDAAIDYIWQKIIENIFENKTQMNIKLTEKLSRLLNHKVFDKNSSAYNNYILSVNKLVEQIKKEIKYIKLTDIENNFFNNY